jgi:ATP-dependent helicase HrpA
MASEMMETTRVYARTAARIDPQWALELGAHVLRVSHSEPFWNEQNGRVMVKQRTRLYGLELESKAVSYGKIDPVHATEIFIREGSTWRSSRSWGSTESAPTWTVAPSPWAIPSARAAPGSRCICCSHSGGVAGATAWVPRASAAVRAWR